jgi:phosphatidylglycerol---prolipoprotein diacylglyceryl transferase
MHIYGVLVALAVWLGYQLVLKRAKKYGISESLLDSLFLPVVVGGVIGARLYHVMDKWSYYSSNPVAIFQVWNGGLGIFGAIIGGFIALIIYIKIKKIKLDLLVLLDLLAPSLALGQTIGRWGNYFNNEVLGPNGEPIFMYESLWMAIGFLILMKLKKNVFAFYLIWYGAGRFVLEFWRSGTAMIGEFKTAQIISVIFIIFGLILNLRKSKVKL